MCFCGHTGKCIVLTLHPYQIRMPDSQPLFLCELFCRIDSGDHGLISEIRPGNRAGSDCGSGNGDHGRLCLLIIGIDKGCHHRTPGIIIVLEIFIILSSAKRFFQIRKFVFFSYIIVCIACMILELWCQGCISDTCHIALPCKDDNVNLIPYSYSAGYSFLT